MPYAALILLFLAMLTAAPLGSARDQLVVDTAAPRSTAPALGTNLNYLVDAPLTALQLAATGARVLDSAEVERRRAPGHLRQALALLAAWQDDALSAAELGAITAAQRIARQAQTETRTAALARIVRRLLITQGLDQ